MLLINVKLKFLYSFNSFQKIQLREKHLKRHESDFKKARCKKASLMIYFLIQPHRFQFN